MNWKLIWKYTGLIFAATLLVGFFFGLIGNFYIKTGEQNTIPFVIVTALANLAATAVNYRSNSETALLFTRRRFCCFAG